MAKAGTNLPPRPFRVFDRQAREQARAKAAEACRERDPVKRRDLKQEAVNLWQQAFGRRA
jgi:hypothetical protein